MDLEQQFAVSWILNYSIKSLVHVYHLTMEILVSFFQMRELQGGFAPLDPHEGLCPFEPHWGFHPRPPPQNRTTLKSSPTGLTMRTVSNSHYRSHTGPIFAKYNVLRVTDMFALELGTFMYRNSMNKLPSAFNNYFTKRSDVHNYPTRHGNHLNVPKNKTFSDHSVRTSGPQLWNSLENSLKNSKSVKHFRNQFKQKLISSYD